MEFFLLTDSSLGAQEFGVAFLRGLDYNSCIMKKFLCVLLISLLLFSVVLSAAACSGNDSEDLSPSETIARWQKLYTAGDFGIRSKKNPFVEFTFDSGETIRLELYPNVAPLSVNNFITYVQEGFYEGIAFHRIISSAIQWGGYEVKEDKLVYKAATHDPIKGEFKENGFNNTLSHRKGVISMARSSADSATSEVFICPVDVTSYDGKYAAFGRVIDEESMTVVTRIASFDTSSEELYKGDSYSVASDVPETRLTVKKAVLVWDK